MSKILFWLKNLLLFLLIFLVIKYIIIFDLTNFSFIIFLSLFIVFSILQIKDLFTKANNDKYNILVILVLSIMNFVFLRTIYDNGFIFNSNIISKIKDSYEIMKQNMLYLSQNLIYFIILMILTLVYRALNLTKEKKENKIINITFMIGSVITIIPTIYTIIDYIIIKENGYYSVDFPFFYLLFILFFMGIILYRFIGGKYKDTKWIFIISLSFNLVALITIFIHLNYCFSLIR